MINERSTQRPTMLSREEIERLNTKLDISNDAIERAKQIQAEESITTFHHPEMTYEIPSGCIMSSDDHIRLCYPSTIEEPYRHKK